MQRCPWRWSKKTWIFTESIFDSAHHIFPTTIMFVLFFQLFSLFLIENILDSGNEIISFLFFVHFIGFNNVSIQKFW